MWKIICKDKVANRQREQKQCVSDYSNCKYKNLKHMKCLWLLLSSYEEDKLKFRSKHYCGV